MVKPVEVDKAVKTGSQNPHEIAKKLNEKLGKPLDIGKSRGPLRESGSTLPPMKKSK